MGKIKKMLFFLWYNLFHILPSTLVGGGGKNITIERKNILVRVLLNIKDNFYPLLCNKKKIESNKAIAFFKNFLPYFNTFLEVGQKILID